MGLHCREVASPRRAVLSPVCKPRRLQWRRLLIAACTTRGQSIATTTTLSSDVLVDASTTAQRSTVPPQMDGELYPLLQLLPPAVRSVVEGRPDVDQLVEVVMDLGRPPSARFPHGDVELNPQPVTADDLAQAVAQLGHFDGDNRAGIDSTLHRISCIRNRAGRVVGLTCRVGRSVPGAAELVRDLVLAGRSVLLLGRPGVGKTTALREVCRIAADESHRRVVIVDTSNEIGGDGDVPHPSIGGARRMQVSRPEAQHAVMVEAVENHMPQVVVIDEISTLAECAAARTIAQRGVQLVATAHGNRLENVIKNPTLADLVGGIQSVTLGDEEARRRGVQKSILERAAPPTFDVAVEMEDRGRWRVHMDVGLAVDSILSGGEAAGQTRFLDNSGHVTRANYMGTVQRTDSNGAVTTSEWWADEAGEQEPLLWPSRQDRGAGASTSRLPSGSAAGGGGGSGSRSASLAAAVAPLSVSLRGSEVGGGSNSFRISSNSGSVSAGRGGGELRPSSGGSSNAGSAGADVAMPSRMRAYLVMDDEAAARVRAVLVLLRREAYEAALVAGAGGPPYTGGAAAGGGGGSESLIELVPDLETADVVIGTKSKLRNTPKIKNAAKKRDLPIYALTATSTSALLRNLCPLLGLDPLAVAEVVRAGTAAGRSAGGDEGYVDGERMLLSDEESDEGEEGMPLTLGPNSGSGGGQRRSLDLSAADDYAELLATTVRELRYAPLDRSYAQHVLGRFVEEMTAAPAPATAGSSAAAVRAGSLAAVAWGCSFVKHRKKFVGASRRELGLVAEACGERWGEFSGSDLLRAATGFAGMRLAPPTAAWLDGLTAAARDVLSPQQQQQQQLAGPTDGGRDEAPVVGAASATVGDAAVRTTALSADEASRLLLALAELDMLWHEAERLKAGAS